MMIMLLLLSELSLRNDLSWCRSCTYPLADECWMWMCIMTLTISSYYFSPDLLLVAVMCGYCWRSITSSLLTPVYINPIVSCPFSGEDTFVQAGPRLLWSRPRQCTSSPFGERQSAALLDAGRQLHQRLVQRKKATSSVSARPSHE